MRKVLRAAILAGACLMGSLNMSAAAQTETPDAETVLQEARAALEAEPGSDPARKAYSAVIEKAINAATRAGNTDDAFQLTEEYIAYLDVRLSVDPSDARRRWTRYRALTAKSNMAVGQLNDRDLALGAARRAEKDIRILRSEKPNIVTYKTELARTLSSIGWMTWNGEDPTVPDNAYGEAVELAREVLAQKSDDKIAAAALAYGLWWKASGNFETEKTYEANEASLPIYEEAALAFKDLAALSDSKVWAIHRAQVWGNLGETYLQLGDDAEAFKAFRFGFQLMKAVSDKYPQDAALYRKVYLVSAYIAGFVGAAEEKLVWWEQAKVLLDEAKATGRLHQDDEGLLAEADRQIGFNTAMKNASSPEEKIALAEAFVQELTANGVEVLSGKIEVDED